MKNALNPEPKPRGSSGSQTIDRAALLLKMVSAARTVGLPLSELVKLSGLTKPTVRRLLIALVENGLVEQGQRNKRYYAGPETYALGVFAAERYGVHESATESLVRIASACGDAALLSMPRGNDTVCLARVEGAYPLRSHVLQPGHRHPLGCGAPGIALLSQLSDERVTESLLANAERLVKNYPRITPKLIWGQVNAARALGYALNEGLIFEGSLGIAVAVHDGQGNACAALGIAGVASRFSKERIDAMAALLREEKCILEDRLQQIQQPRRSWG